MRVWSYITPLYSIITQLLKQFYTLLWTKTQQLVTECSTAQWRDVIVFNFTFPSIISLLQIQTCAHTQWALCTFTAVIIATSPRVILALVISTKRLHALSVLLHQWSTPAMPFLNSLKHGSVLHQMETEWLWTAVFMLGGHFQSHQLRSCQKWEVAVFMLGDISSPISYVHVRNGK